ncbi:MAG TPA: hypothetical protein VJ885_01560 [Thermoanaerobaculia bacterium]|nr:hypothetical protein [Thermoanaerobaculia bacterium]
MSRDSWLRLLPALIANSADIPHLEAPRLRLESITAETGDLLTQQAALSASKQDVSRRLQALIAEGRQLAAFLRVGVKQRYGTRSEKLTAFHLQPFRGRKIKTSEEAVNKTPPASEPTVPPSANPQ